MSELSSLYTWVSYLHCTHELAIFIVHMSELSSLYTWVSYLHCTHEWAIFILHMIELSSLYTWVSYLHCTHESYLHCTHEWAIFIVQLHVIYFWYSEFKSNSYCLLYRDYTVVKTFQKWTFFPLLDVQWYFRMGHSRYFDFTQWNKKNVSLGKIMIYLSQGILVISWASM
jgi:hypothetical protein